MKKLLFILLISVFASLSFRAAAQTNVVSDAVEFAVLKDLFDSLGGSSWTVKTNWPAAGSWPSSATSSQFGTWTGISVVNGDITQINLPNNNLTGHLPASIANLGKLKYLLLPNNHLNGNFPLAVCNISTLQTLTLASNQLTGSLPSQIGNITGLISLIVTSNNLGGRLPSTLGNLTALQNLQVDFNQFTGPIPNLSSCTQLVTLFLSNNPLATTIPDMFGQMTHLYDLRIANAQLTGCLPPSLGASGSTLYRLTLNNNKLTGPIPSTYSSFTTLGELYIYSNQLTGTLPSLIGNWSSLGIFDIHSNKFTGNVPSSISGCTHAYSINFSDNQFTGAFPTLTSSVVTLAATNNSFTSLPSSLLSLPSMANVSFDNNELTSVPNFGTYSNRANLVLKLQNNRLDFSMLENHVGKGIKTLTQTPQKTINDVATQVLTVGDSLVLMARPAGTGTSYTWEKLSANGSTWTTLTNDQDGSGTNNKYKRITAAASDAGSYRWKTTSSIITGQTIQSDPILIKAAQVFTLDRS